MVFNLSLPKINAQDQKPTPKQTFDMDMVADYQGNVMRNALPQHGEDEMMANDMFRRGEELIRWQQDMAEEVYRILYHMRGFTYDEPSNSWIRYEGFREIGNDKFYAYLRTVLIPLTSRNEFNSNYSEKIARDRLVDVMKSVILEIGQNYTMYNLQPEDFNYIVDMVERIIHPSPFRALNDGERRNARSIYKHIETNAQMPNVAIEAKKKILGVF